MAWLSDKKQQVKINQLLRTLSDSDTNKHNQAARELLAMGEAGAESLVSTLNSQEPRQRELVAQILVRLGKKAIPALNNAMKNAPFSIQKETVPILGRMKNQEALNNLFVISKNENYKLQILAIESLGKAKNRQAVPHLLVALNDADPDVRIAAVIVLGKFRDPRTYVNIADLLDDAEIKVRIATVKALEEINDPSVIPYLMEALYDSFWWYGGEERMQALLGAIASYDKAALNKLRVAMNAKEPTVRRYAIALLRPMREPSIMDDLEMAFYDTNYDVAEKALEALLEFGEDALPILSKALVSPNTWIREKSVWGLGVIGGERAIVYLLEMLDDKTDAVRKEAIRSLSKLKDPRALPTLHAISQKRENREVAKLARQAIAEIEVP